MMAYWSNIPNFSNNDRNGWFVDNEGNFHKDFFYVNDSGRIGRPDGPARISVYSRQGTTSINWRFIKDEESHREDGPAEVRIQGRFEIENIPSNIFETSSIEDIIKKVYVLDEMAILSETYYIEGKLLSEKNFARWEITRKLKGLV